jgi:hypothetical protein
MTEQQPYEVVDRREGSGLRRQEETANAGMRFRQGFGRVGRIMRR